MAGESLESALESAFSDTPVEEKIVPTAEPDEVAPSDEAADEAAAELLAEPTEDVAEQEQAVPVADPEYEVVADGETHVIRGAEQVKELIQKGLTYNKRHGALAKEQEALQARIQIVTAQEQFTQQIASDLAELRMMDAHLDQFARVDWNSAFDTDAFNAMKMKEQRDQLKEARNAKYQELNYKHDQFRRGQAQAAERMVGAEYAALMEKVPEWRNPEKAAAEKREIVTTLTSRYGFNPAELSSITDHRAIVIMREHVRMLKAQDSAKAKQIRNAPPVVKPGTVQKQPNAKADFAKQRGLIKALGQKGNHKAQEALVTQMLTKAFK